MLIVAVVRTMNPGWRTRNIAPGELGRPEQVLVKRHQLDVSDVTAMAEFSLFTRNWIINDHDRHWKGRWPSKVTLAAQLPIKLTLILP